MGNPFRPIRGGGMRGGATPPMMQIAFDRFGTTLEPGQIVMFHSDIDLCFEVVDVRPVLNPSLPQGAMQITLQCAPFAFPIQPGGRDIRLVKIGLTAEREKAEAEAAMAARNGKSTIHEVPSAGEPLAEPEEDDQEQAEQDLCTETLAAHPTSPVRYLLCPACQHMIESALIKPGDICDRCGDAKYIETAGVP